MMTITEKVEMTMTLLGETDSALEDKIQVYLTAAGKEIISWRYSYTKESVSEVPDEYEMTQIQAVIAGYTLSGAENQTLHSENGIQRTFKYSDMLDYIRAHVIPKVGVVL